MHFRDIPAQDSVKERLLATVKEGRVSHAQLFLGPEGSGSLALALAYAQYISCESRQNADSCGECASCRKYERLIHPDLHFSYPFFAKHKEDTAVTFLTEWRRAFLSNPYLGIDDWRDQLDAENKQANINIAECHQIIRKLSLKPFESAYKTLILWLPEYLDKEGNTLLKIIEEPPANTLFLLVAQNSEQVLNTILSRTQLVKINRFTDDEISEALCLRYGTSTGRAKQLAYLAEGNLRLALRLATEEPDDHFALFSKWMRLCATNKTLELTDFADHLARLGREHQKGFLRYSANLVHESLMALSGASGLIHLSGSELEFITNFSKVMNLAKAEALSAELERAHYHVERNANPKILFLDVSLLFVKILKFNTLPAGTHYITV
jgi:DNA polymerase-3 subunit delta'